MYCTVEQVISAQSTLVSLSITPNTDSDPFEFPQGLLYLWASDGSEPPVVFQGYIAGKHCLAINRLLHPAGGNAAHHGVIYGPPCQYRNIGIEIEEDQFVGVCNLFIFSLPVDLSLAKLKT